jgi:hypothetical protein
VGIGLVGGGGQSRFAQLVGSWARAVGVHMVSGQLGFEGPWEAPLGVVSVWVPVEQPRKGPGLVDGA